jgi:drug/metabolite transporter (DMT)-like permease
MKQDNTKIVLGYILICLIWGSTWMVIRVGLDSLTPVFSAGLRFIMAGVVLFLFIKLKGLKLQVDKVSVFLYIILGIFSFGTSYGLVYWGEKYIPSSLSSILFATYPLFTAIFANFLIKDEKLSTDKILGIIIGFIGIVVIFSNELDFSLSYNLLGMLAVIISAITQGLITVTMKKYGHHLNPLTMNLIPMLIAGIMMTAYGIATEDISSNVFDWKAILSVSYLAVFGSIITFTTYYWLLQRINAVLLSLNSFITPIIAIILGYLFLGEVLSINHLTGTILVLMGILFANFKGLKKFYLVRVERS